VTAIVSEPAFRDRHLTARSLVPAINGPEEFGQQIREDRAMAARVVKEAGLQPQ
jgi:tripartite-type tricarboxylate transporter receptor subunit TctC